MKHQPYWKLKVQQMELVDKKSLCAFMGIGLSTLYKYIQKPGLLSVDSLTRLKHFFTVKHQQEFTYEDLLKEIEL